LAKLDVVRDDAATATGNQLVVLLGSAQAAPEPPQLPDVEVQAERLD
jgi:hypothetical protein